MFSRCDIDVVSHHGHLWLRRRYYPKPNADMLMVEDFLVPLRDDERDFQHGRFRRFTTQELPHSVQVWLDHTDIEKRGYNFTEMLIWLCEAMAEWSFDFGWSERIGVSFSFSDRITAFMFMLEFGGSLK